jgi:flagellar hook assembly protein FlgD
MGGDCVRSWVVLFIALMLIFPASVGLATTRNSNNDQVTRMEKPVPMSNILSSSKTFSMKGTNRHAFSFKVQGRTHISVYIKNLGGTIIKRLVDQPWPGGTVTTLWDGKMNNGTYVSDGKYKLVATSSSGKSSFTKTFEFKVIDKIAPTIKYSQTRLYFSPLINKQVIIPFELNKKAKVTAIVYDKAGDKVGTILNEKTLNPGQQQLAWTGRNAKGIKVEDGAYQIVVTSVADNKLRGIKRKATVLVDSVNPSTSITLSDVSFKLDGKNSFSGQIQLTEKVKVNAYIVDSNGAKVKKIVTNTAYLPGTFNFNWDGKDDFNYTRTDGQYRYSLELTDLAGNTGTVNSSLFQLQDWSLPSISSAKHVDLIEGSGVAIPYSVSKIGKVNVGIYKNNQLVQEVVKNEPVTSGNHSFMWSGTGFAGGNYQYTIMFQDQYGQQIHFSGDITLTTTAMKIHYPNVVQLHETGYKRAEVYFELSHDAIVTIDIYSSAGYKLKSILKDQALQKGIRKFEWNGNGDYGGRVVGEEFIYIIRAKNQFGKDTTIEGKLSNKFYPSWLASHSINFNQNGRTDSVEINVTTDEVVKLQFSLYTSLTSTTAVDLKLFNLDKGQNVIYYTKPTTDHYYYTLRYEDRLGNLYTYVTDEN